jgi:hypothetical protein
MRRSFLIGMTAALAGLAAYAADVPEDWAWKTPVKPALPKVKQAGWVRNPIDAFVLARLEAANLRPAAEADRATLIRRLYFDLIGLPPTPEEVVAFVNDQAPDAPRDEACGWMCCVPLCLITRSVMTTKEAVAMPISSRTPEGSPNQCPLCGNAVRIEPSQPFGDAPCPSCGTLLWFVALGQEQRFFDPEDELVVELLSDKLGIDADQLRGRKWEELGIDSLDLVEWIMEWEERQE